MRVYRICGDTIVKERPTRGVSDGGGQRDRQLVSWIVGRPIDDDLMNSHTSSHRCDSVIKSILIQLVIILR